MPIENFSEVQEYFKSNGESEDVKAFLSGLTKPADITLEGVQKYFGENQDAKKWLESERDKYHNKALKTWQENNLQKLVDEEIKKKYPEMDPKDKALKDMEAEIAKIKLESQRKDLATKAIKLATDKGISLSLIEQLMPNIPDEQSLGTVIESIEKEMQTAIKAGVEEEVKKRLGDNTYTPPRGDSNTPIGGLDIMKIAKANQVKRI